MDNNDLMPIEHYKNLAEIEDTYWWHQGRIYAAISLLMPYLKSNTIRFADVGCGTGGFLKQIISIFNIQDAIGLDGSIEALTAAEKRGLNTQLINFNHTLSIKGGKCNIIACMDVLEHIENEQNFLKNIYDNLLPDGILLINVPAYNFLFSSWDKVCGHKRRYSTRHLTNILKANNFKIIKMSYLFSYALPIAIFRRLLGSGYTEKTCVFPEVSHFTNKTLLFFARVEANIIKIIKIPFGTSVLCIAKRKQ